MRLWRRIFQGWMQSSKKSHRMPSWSRETPLPRQQVQSLHLIAASPSYTPRLDFAHSTSSPPSLKKLIGSSPPSSLHYISHQRQCRDQTCFGRLSQQKTSTSLATQ